MIWNCWNSCWEEQCLTNCRNLRVEALLLSLCPKCNEIRWDWNTRNDFYLLLLELSDDGCEVFCSIFISAWIYNCVASFCCKRCISINWITECLSVSIIWPKYANFFISCNLIPRVRVHGTETFNSEEEVVSPLHQLSWTESSAEDHCLPWCDCCNTRHGISFALSNNWVCCFWSIGCGNNINLVLSYKSICKLSSLCWI